MGRARADDRAQALSLGPTTLARLDDALADVESAHDALPASASCGFATAMAPLRASWAAAEGHFGALQHNASAYGSESSLRARDEGLARIEAVRGALEQSKKLHAHASRAAPPNVGASADQAVMMAMLRRAGADVGPGQRRLVARCRDQLRTLCAAFAQHHAQASETALREAWRTTLQPSRRTEAWHALHARGREREVLVREILLLRHQWAQAAGYPSFAAMQCDGSPLGSPDAVQRWLASPLAAAAQGITQEDTRPASVPTADASRLDRDTIEQGLGALLAPWTTAAATLRWDIAPRANKHPGTWTSSFTAPNGTRRVTICASLPARLRRAHVRALLHEAGHAAELLEGLPPPAPLCGPDRVRMEVASLWFEQASWDHALLQRLGLRVEGAAVAAERLRAAGRPLLLQLALASTDLALHHTFHPTHDGSPLAWARRVLSTAEGQPRDPADSTVAMHAHLFSHPRGYAARYVAYPLAEAAADVLVARHGAGLPARQAFADAMAKARTPAGWSALIQPDRWGEAIKRRRAGRG